VYDASYGGDDDAQQQQQQRRVRRDVTRDSNNNNIGQHGEMLATVTRHDDDDDGASFYDPQSDYYSSIYDQSVYDDYHQQFDPAESQYNKVRHVHHCTTLLRLPCNLTVSSTDRGKAGNFHAKKLMETRPKC